MKILYLDIETAPNNVWAWGLFKQNIAINQIEEPGYTLCFSAQWEGSNAVIFEAIEFNENEELPPDARAMLDTLWQLLDEADVVVHYNGKKFDIPTINREFVKYGYVPPSFYKQIDLYQVVRMNFRFASNKLDFVCQELGLGAKTHHKGMELWRACMNGDAKGWRIMERYNKQDVRLTRKLYMHLRPWIKSHPSVVMGLKNNAAGCPTCGSRKVTRIGEVMPAKVNIYELFRCEDCGAQSRSRLAIKGYPKPELI